MLSFDILHVRLNQLYLSLVALFHILNADYDWRKLFFRHFAGYPTHSLNLDYSVSTFLR